MGLDIRTKGVLRRLIYPVQFDVNPVNGVDRIIRLVVMRSSDEIPPQEYIDAIDAGLASDDLLSDLIPQDHPEALIRDYLDAMRKQLLAGFAP